MFQDTTLKQFLNDLFLERDRLNKALTEVEVTINVIERQLSLKNKEHQLSNKQEEVVKPSQPLQSQLFDDSSIDKRLSFDDQILQAFEAVGKFVKLKSFAAGFKESTGTIKDEDYISGVVRKLRRKGQVINVRFNYNDANTFWGLPEWISKDNGDAGIIERYFPDSNEISRNSPFEINRNKKG